MTVDTAQPAAEAATSYHECLADLQVSKRVTVAEGVAALTLTDPTEQELPDWSPGAHIDLMLSDGLVRQYSLCGRPTDRYAWRVGVLLEPNSRGGSRHVHEALDVGSTLPVRGPRNHFPLVESPRYVFIAGGIGITPILPMVASAAGNGRDWELIYGGRTRASMAFLDKLAEYGRRVRVYPQDEMGLIPLASVLSTPREDCLVYCCGPEPLIEAVEAFCAGWPPGSLHTERFKAKVVEAAPDSVATFEVVCQRSGLTLTIPPDRSILDVADGAGLMTLSACREGICGTCETAVIEGEPEHRDSVLTPDEKASGGGSSPTSR